MTDLSPSATADRVVAQARAALQAAAVPEDAAPMAAYLKTDQPFFGVKAGPRRQIERALRAIPIPDAPTYRAVVLALWGQPEREAQHLAIDVATRHTRFTTFAQLDLYERMVREGQWWDLVDPIATWLVGTVWRRDRKRTAPVMDAWIRDPDPWIRRSAILGQLKHREETDLERLFAYCRLCAPETGFFTRKAIGWALRTHGDVDPRAVEAFLTTHWSQLSGLSQREASRKLQAEGWSPPSS